MNYRVADFFDTMTAVFLPEEYKKDLYIFVAQNSKSYEYAKSVFKAEKLIPIPIYSKLGNYMREKEILYSSELTSKLKEKKITHLIVPHRCTPVMKHWAKTHNITLIGTPFAQQQKFENKIYFDSLLKNNGISSPLTITNISELKENKKYVVQKQMSYGLFGTKFSQNKKELENNMSSGQKILVREYLEGIPLGVSIVIDTEGNYFFSAFRRQCFTNSNGFPSSFLGIQWLPSNFFDKQLTSKIYTLLNQLAELLIKMHFTGIANIDLLVTQTTPYILECNPRLSSASDQQFSVSEINGIANPFPFFLNTFLHKKNTGVKGAIPHSSFSGCLLDIDVKGKQKITKIPPIGIYRLYEENVEYKGTDINLMNEKNSFFMIHYLQKKGTYHDFELCSVISPFALFDYKTGFLNHTGKTIYHTLLRIF
ncbi:MAG: ATP-grasp domain-containing protein [Patescibacteria group bacterium]|nr:ATP-grasp domain-containing protein [Patescibacteria group bacterium]